MVLELALAGAFGAIGLRALFTPARFEAAGSRERLLLALHEAARAGFWFSLAGLFLGFALVEDAASFRVFVVVPVILAGVRMLAATALSRRP